MNDCGCERGVCPTCNPNAIGFAKGPIRLRSDGEREAYMQGQRAALKLAKEKGVEYAEMVIDAAQSSVRQAT